MIRIGISILLVCLSPVAASEVPPASHPYLPPVPEWRGASEKLLQDVPQDWRTPAEASGFRTTPGYDETLAFLRRLDRASSLVSLREIGRTAQGRPLVLVIATRDPRHDYDALRRSARARVLVQAGIHAGEIDGKDAGLMLLRDIVTGRATDVLDRATLLFVPVYNPDGHERASATARVNQRGPENAGWRTTARNLNLNRDYAKLEAPESRALVNLMNAVDPDLFLDLHVTDGMDHQYDVTYRFNRDHAWSPSSARWLGNELAPALESGLKSAGHVPGLYFGEKNSHDPLGGLLDERDSARYSIGYGDARHLPSVLLETHSLKPYRRRVLGTYTFIEVALHTAGRDAGLLRKAIAEDRSRRSGSLPIVFAVSEQATRVTEFLGIAHEMYDSPISGRKEVRYLGQPVTQQLPVYTTVPVLHVQRPRAYWIAREWAELGAKLRQHGIRTEELAAPVKNTLAFYKLRDPQTGATANEGRLTVSVKGVESHPHERVWPAGSIRVTTDQPLGNLAMVLLEPQSEDSLFAWGYLPEILQRTEYIEDYVLEPKARSMLAADPALAESWKQALRDPAFAADPVKRMEWFYQRSGMADERYLLYPIAREL